MAKAGFKNIPIKHNSKVVGYAELSKDGDILTAELDEDLLPAVLRQAFLTGLADHLSISIGYKSVVQAPLSQESNTSRWK